MIYIVYDSLGNYMTKFNNYESASVYKFVRGNYHWRIVCVKKK